MRGTFTQPGVGIVCAPVRPATRAAAFAAASPAQGTSALRQASGMN